MAGGVELVKRGAVIVRGGAESGPPERDEETRGGGGGNWAEKRPEMWPRRLPGRRGCLHGGRGTAVLSHVGV